MSHPRFHAETLRDKPAVIMAEGGHTLTFGELERLANQGAHLFRTLGVKADDTIAIWLPNCTDYFVIYWAAQRSGLHITPISTAFNPAEVAYILSNSGARLLVTSGKVANARDLLDAGLPETVDHVFETGDELDLKSWCDALSGLPETPIEDESAGYHMVYSSGTTGRPKGIRQPLTGGPATAPLTLAESIKARYGVDKNSIYLSPAPLYHTAPLVYCTCMHRIGATAVVMEKFTAEAALEALESFRVTICQMVPTMFIRMLRLPDNQRLAYDTSSLQTVIHAAAPCPVDIKHKMIDWLGPILFEYYGGSEGNGSTGIDSHEWLRKPGSVGKANWGIIHICDDEGRELPAGKTGTVYFEGGWDFKYLNDDKKTQESRHPDHPTWSSMGDIGYLDQDDYLFLTDRKAFMIISGGVNIYPQEIEDTLLSHPKVLDAAVFGVPNTDMGEEVKAVVQPADMKDATEAFGTELIELCRSELSKIRIPRSIDFAESLPRGENGKLYKLKLKEKYWKKRGAK